MSDNVVDRNKICILINPQQYLPSPVFSGYVFYHPWWFEYDDLSEAHQAIYQKASHQRITILLPEFALTELISPDGLAHPQPLIRLLVQMNVHRIVIIRPSDASPLHLPHLPNVFASQIQEVLASTALFFISTEGLLILSDQINHSADQAHLLEHYQRDQTRIWEKMNELRNAQQQWIAQAQLERANQTSMETS